MAAVPGASLPELASVYWRPRASERSIIRIGRLWTLSTVAHTLPFIGAALLLAYLNPVTLPVGMILFAHAWAIPELYAARGAGVVRRRDHSGERPEALAAGLLGDLVGHEARDGHALSGLVPERGKLGMWLVGEAGALLIRPSGRRVHCYCVKVTERGLPHGDCVAHLLLALRTDEEGFATVANLAFSGACWRLRRRLSGPNREALDRAAAVMRSR